MRISDWISDGCPSDLFAPHSLSIPSRGTCRGPLVRQIASGDQVKEAAGDMAGAMSGGTEVAAGRIGEEGEGGAFVGRYDGRIMIFMAPKRRRGLGEGTRLGPPPLSKAKRNPTLHRTR